MAYVKWQFCIGQHVVCILFEICNIIQLKMNYTYKTKVILSLIIIILVIGGISVWYYIQYTQQQSQIYSFNNQMKKYTINVENLHRYTNIPSSITKSQSQWDTYYNNEISKTNNLANELEYISPSNQIYFQQNINVFDNWKQAELNYLTVFNEFAQTGMAWQNMGFSIMTDKAYGLSSLNKDQNYLNQQQKTINQLSQQLIQSYDKVSTLYNNWNKVSHDYKPIISL